MKSAGRWMLMAVLLGGWIDPSGAATVAKKSGPRLHIVSVGVAAYRDPRLNLRYAASDALAFANVVTDQAPRIYDSITRTVLLNRYATAANVRRLLRRLGGESRDNDTVVLFLSGHGGMEQKGDYFFATHEADIEDLQHTTLRWEDVARSVRSLQAERLLVFIDSCNAGGTLGGRSASAAKLAEDLSKRANTMIFSSSRGDEFSIELPKRKHGAFTQALLDAFDGLAEGAGNNPKDGRITLSELREFVPKRVTQLSKGIQNPQKPGFGGCDPEAVMVLTPRPGSKAGGGPVESLLPEVNEEF